MLEMAAIFHLLVGDRERRRCRRSSTSPSTTCARRGPRDVIAAAKVTKQGRRMVNVYAEAWQDDRAKPVATANAHFLIKSDDAAPSSL